MKNEVTSKTTDSFVHSPRNPRVRRDKGLQEGVQFGVDEVRL